MNDPKYYTVTFDANGGQFSDGSATFVMKNIKEQSAISAPVAPLKKDYAFIGWSKRAESLELWQFGSDTVNENLTLYATWNYLETEITNVEGGEVKENKISMFVDFDVKQVSLSDKIECSLNCVWKLYSDSLGQSEIPTKIASGKNGELENGNNEFYIVVSTADGLKSSTYSLTIYRSYKVAVKYYDGDEIIKTDWVYTGDIYKTNYLPELAGYTFNGWKTEDENRFTECEIWGELCLYADKTALQYNVTLDANGGVCDSESMTVTYDAAYVLPVPERTGYTFCGWYDEDGLYVLRLV